MRLANILLAYAAAIGEQGLLDVAPYDPHTDIFLRELDKFLHRIFLHKLLFGWKRPLEI